MELTLAVHLIDELVFGDATRLDGARLIIDQEELRLHLLEDRRLQSVEMEVAKPGQPCRVGMVYDILEPRAKAPGDGSNFPGILGPITVAGKGTTHVLRGAAVTVVDAEAPLANGKIVEMSGPAGEVSPFALLNHLALVPRAARYQ